MSSRGPEGSDQQLHIFKHDDADVEIRNVSVVRTMKRDTQKQFPCDSTPTTRRRRKVMNSTTSTTTTTARKAADDVDEGIGWQHPRDTGLPGAGELTNSRSRTTTTTICANGKEPEENSNATLSSSSSSHIIGARVENFYHPRQHAAFNDHHDTADDGDEDDDDGDEDDDSYHDGQHCFGGVNLQLNGFASMVATFSSSPSSPPAVSEAADSQDGSGGCRRFVSAGSPSSSFCIPRAVSIEDVASANDDDDDHARCISSSHSDGPSATCLLHHRASAGDQTENNLSLVSAPVTPAWASSASSESWQSVWSSAYSTVMTDDRENEDEENEEHEESLVVVEEHCGPSAEADAEILFTPPGSNAMQIDERDGRWNNGHRHGSGKADIVIPANTTPAAVGRKGVELKERSNEDDDDDNDNEPEGRRGSHGSIAGALSESCRTLPVLIDAAPKPDDLSGANADSQLVSGDSGRDPTPGHTVQHGGLHVRPAAVVADDAKMPAEFAEWDAMAESVAVQTLLDDKTVTVAVINDVADCHQQKETLTTTIGTVESAGVGQQGDAKVVTAETDTVEQLYADMGRYHQHDRHEIDEDGQVIDGDIADNDEILLAAAWMLAAALEEDKAAEGVGRLKSDGSGAAALLEGATQALPLGEDMATVRASMLLVEAIIGGEQHAKASLGDNDFRSMLGNTDASHCFNDGDDVDVECRDSRCVVEDALNTLSDLLLPSFRSSSSTTQKMTAFPDDSLPNSLAHHLLHQPHAVDRLNQHDDEAGWPECLPPPGLVVGVGQSPETADQQNVVCVNDNDIHEDAGQQHGERCRRHGAMDVEAQLGCSAGVPSLSGTMIGMDATPAEVLRLVSHLERTTIGSDLDVFGNSMENDDDDGAIIKGSVDTGDVLPAGVCRLPVDLAQLPQRALDAAGYDSGDASPSVPPGLVVLPERDSTDHREHGDAELPASSSSSLQCHHADIADAGCASGSSMLALLRGYTDATQLMTAVRGNDDETNSLPRPSKARALRQIRRSSSSISSMASSTAQVVAGVVEALGSFGEDNFPFDHCYSNDDDADDDGHVAAHLPGALFVSKGEAPPKDEAADEEDDGDCVADDEGDEGSERIRSGGVRDGLRKRLWGLLDNSVEECEDVLGPMAGDVVEEIFGHRNLAVSALVVRWLIHHRLRLECRISRSLSSSLSHDDNDARASSSSSSSSPTRRQRRRTTRTTVARTKENQEGVDVDPPGDGANGIGNRIDSEGRKVEANKHYRRIRTTRPQQQPPPPSSSSGPPPSCSASSPSSSSAIRQVAVATTEADGVSVSLIGGSNGPPDHHRRRHLQNFCGVKKRLSKHWTSRDDVRCALYLSLAEVLNEVSGIVQSKVVTDLNDDDEGRSHPDGVVLSAGPSEQAALEAAGTTDRPKGSRSRDYDATAHDDERRRPLDPASLRFLDLGVQLNRYRAASCLAFCRQLRRRRFRRTDNGDKCAADRSASKPSLPSPALTTAGSNEDDESCQVVMPSDEPLKYRTSARPSSTNSPDPAELTTVRSQHDHDGDNIIRISLFSRGRRQPRRRGRPSREGDESPPMDSSPPSSGAVEDNHRDDDSSCQPGVSTATHLVADTMRRRGMATSGSSTIAASSGERVSGRWDFAGEVRPQSSEVMRSSGGLAATVEGSEVKAVDDDQSKATQMNLRPRRAIDSHQSTPPNSTIDDAIGGSRRGRSCGMQNGYRKNVDDDANIRRPPALMKAADGSGAAGRGRPFVEVPGEGKHTTTKTTRQTSRDNRRRARAAEKRSPSSSSSTSTMTTMTASSTTSSFADVPMEHFTHLMLQDNHRVIPCVGSDAPGYASSDFRVVVVNDLAGLHSLLERLSTYVERHKRKSPPRQQQQPHEDGMPVLTTHEDSSSEVSTYRYAAQRSNGQYVGQHHGTQTTHTGRQSSIGADFLGGHDSSALSPVPTNVAVPSTTIPVAASSCFSPSSSSAVPGESQQILPNGDLQLSGTGDCRPPIDSDLLLAMMTTERPSATEGVEDVDPKSGGGGRKIAKSAIEVDKRGYSTEQCGDQLDDLVVVKGVRSLRDRVKSEEVLQAVEDNAMAVIIGDGSDGLGWSNRQRQRKNQRGIARLIAACARREREPSPHPTSETKLGGERCSQTETSSRSPRDPPTSTSARSTSLNPKGPPAAAPTAGSLRDALLSGDLHRDYLAFIVRQNLASHGTAFDYSAGASGGAFTPPFAQQQQNTLRRARPETRSQFRGPNHQQHRQKHHQSVFPQIATTAALPMLSSRSSSSVRPESTRHLTARYGSSIPHEPQTDDISSNRHHSRAVSIARSGGSPRGWVLATPPSDDQHEDEHGEELLSFSSSSPRRGTGEAVRNLKRDGEGGGVRAFDDEVDPDGGDVSKGAGTEKSASDDDTCGSKVAVIVSRVADENSEEIRDNDCDDASNNEHAASEAGRLGAGSQKQTVSKSCPTSPRPHEFRALQKQDRHRPASTLLHPMHAVSHQHHGRPLLGHRPLLGSPLDFSSLDGNPSSIGSSPGSQATQSPTSSAQGRGRLASTTTLGISRSTPVSLHTSPTSSRSPTPRPLPPDHLTALGCPIAGPPSQPPRLLVFDAPQPQLAADFVGYIPPAHPAALRAAMKTPRGLQPPRGSSSPFPIFNSHSPRPQHYLHTSGTNIHPPRPSSASPSSPASSRLNPLSPPFDLRLPPRAMALSADNPGRPFGNSSARSSILNSPSSGGGGDSSLVATGSSIAPSLNSRNDDASPLPGASPSIGISARSASNQSHASEGSQDGGVDELNSDNDRDDKFNDVDNRHGKSDLIDCRVRIDESGRQSSAGDNKNQDHVGGDPPLSALGTAEHFPDADEPKPTEDKESISKPREALPAPLLKLPLGGGTEAIAKKSFTLNANAAPFSIGCSEAIGGGRGSSTWRSTGSVSPAASPLSPRIADGVPFIPPPLAHHFGGHHHLQQQFGPHGNGLQQHPHLLSPTTKGGRMRQVGSGNALPPFQKNAYGGALLYGEGAGVFPLYQPHHHPNHFHHPAHHPHFPLHTHRQYHQPHGSTNHLHHFLPLDVGHGLDHLVTPRRAPPASRFTTSFNRAGGGSSAPTTTAGDDQRESSSPADPRADADAVEDHKLAAAAGRGEDSSNSATSTSATFSEVEDKIQNQPPGNGFSSSTSPVAAATTSSSLKPPSAAEASAAAENHVAGSRPQLPLLPSLPLQTNSLHLMHHHHQHMHHQYHNHHRHQHQFHYHPQHHVSLLSPRNPQAGEATVHHHPQFPRTPRVGGAALSGRLPSSPSAAGGHSTTEEIYSPYNVHSAHQLIAPPSYHQASSAPHRRMAYPPHNAGGGEYSFFFQPQHHHDGFSGAPSATHRSHAPRGGPADERRDPAADLMAQPVIAVDLEGVRLHRNGQLCLLQLAIADDVYSAYVVDVHVLGEKAFRMKSRTGLTLKKLLEDPGILKVWFDPRNDSDALYHQFSITPNGIFDVQLAEVALRRSKVLNVQYVKGLPKLLRMSSFIPPAHKVLAEKLDHRAKLLYEPLLGGCYERFRKRPIDPLLLMYAAHDVHYSIPLALILAHELGSRWVAAVLRESQLRGEWWQKTEYESPSSQAPPFFA